MRSFTLSGNIVDVVSRTVFTGMVTVEGDRIASITPTPTATSSHYILPGFIDAHVHVESSMLVPSEFARLAVVHGTVATVSDPHEIANVLGIDGVRYMCQNGALIPFHFYFGAPSCVPATPFETAGATLNDREIEILLGTDHLKYLSEMMNYPAVLARDPLVMDKIQVANRHKVPIDGHAPGLKGEDAARYCAAGISTDHECFTLEEALDKIRHGMKIIIREGSAAKNYNALHTLLRTHPDRIFFCSDDKHPDDLIRGHINELVKRSIVQHGYDIMDVLRAASYNPICHYGLDVGFLQPGQPADFIVVDTLKDFTVLQTYVRGELVAEQGKTYIPSVTNQIVNRFEIGPKKEADFVLDGPGGVIQVIEAIDGELVTKKRLMKINKPVADVGRDLLKLVVVNRYQEAPVSIAFITGFSLKRGALASCIAHDSHNIIAVGTNDADLCKAVNAIIAHKGGIAVADSDRVDVLALPVAGIMSPDDGYLVAKEYSRLDKRAKELGTRLYAPFMTLSFMALLVIPSLKLSDKGLFDGTRFCFTPLHDRQPDSPQVQQA